MPLLKDSLLPKHRLRDRERQNKSRGAGARFRGHNTSAGPGATPKGIAGSLYCDVHKDATAIHAADVSRSGNPGGTVQELLTDNLWRAFAKQTVEFWNDKYGVVLSEDEARQAAANVAGYFHVLANWAKTSDTSPMYANKIEVMDTGIVRKDGRV